MTKLAYISLLFSCFCVGCGMPFVFKGISMLPNYKDGDKLFVESNFSEIKRGDVIIHLYPRDKSKVYMKRVIGLPNETIEIRNGKVFINETELLESYVDQTYNEVKTDMPSVKIAEDNYFVMGDNRDNSSDSRIWGTVEKELIKGKAGMKYLSGSK